MFSVLLLKLSISKQVGKNPRPCISTFLYCRYGRYSCNLWIGLPIYVFIFFHGFLIKCEYECWPWTRPFLVQLSLTLTFKACFEIATDLEISGTDAFAARVRTGLLTESYLCFCCSCLQSCLYAMRIFCWICSGGRICNYEAEFDACVISINFFRASSLSCH